MISDDVEYCRRAILNALSEFIPRKLINKMFGEPMSQKVWTQGKKKVYEKPADPSNWVESTVPGAYRQLVCDRCHHEIKDGETVVMEEGKSFHPLCRGRS